jgi:hypothetical protein
MRYALWTMRSSMASANVGSPMTSCPALMGNWLVINDWAAWDLERCDGLRIEVKQSAAVQSWGPSTSSPRFSIAASRDYYPVGKTYVLNPSHKRFADLYIFAWHEGYDQRAVSEWRIYVVKADRLPEQQKSIGLAAIKKLSTPVGSEELLRKINGVSG